MRAVGGRVLGLDKGEQLLARIVLFDDPVTDIGPVKARNKDTRVVERQALNDLVTRQCIGRRRQRDARHGREAFVQHRELDVLGPEVVAPLRHAVRLVDREQADAAALEQVEEARRHQPFRRNVENLEPAGEQVALDRGGLGSCQRRIEHRSAYAGFGQRRDLVLHQRDQRRHHDADALAGTLAQQRRNLVAQRLAAAGRHQHQAIAARRDMVDDLTLRPRKAW